MARAPAGRSVPAGPVVLLALALAARPVLAETPAPPVPGGTTPDRPLVCGGGPDAGDGAAGTEGRVDAGVAARDAAAVDPPPRGSVVRGRLEREQTAAFNPYYVTTHKRNYFVPLSYTTNLGESLYERVAPQIADELKPYEAQFQLSFKVRVNERDLLFDDDALYFGLTIESWWQLYSKGLSSPFRETNYQPELFYLNPLAWRPFGGDLALSIGFEHQSNGQIQGFSRSWNRLYAAAVYGRGPFVAALRPWYRIPEKPKESPEDPRGDDNPDILDFYGHGELMLGWRGPRRGYALTAHGNPSSGKGGAELAVSFPAFGRFRAFVSYFEGYGDSLIDYDRFQRRVGVGVLLSNLF